MRRNRLGSKTKNGQSSHHISFYSRVKVGYEKSILKVREGCVSRASPKFKEGPCSSTKARQGRQGRALESGLAFTKEKPQVSERTKTSEKCQEAGGSHGDGGGREKTEEHDGAGR
eukprot:4269242-Pleurochrysis_carterae.AAC.1